MLIPFPAFPKVLVHLKPPFLSSRFTPAAYDISSGENIIGQELSAQRDSSLVLEDNGSSHLVYIPSQMLMPQKSMTKYEKDWDSEAIASLTSGKEMKSYTE